MQIEKAYLFARQITAGEVPPEPVTVFENGVWNQQLVGQYYQPGGAYSPFAPANFYTCRSDAMRDYGKLCYNNSQNLYALGRDYQNLYALAQTNISRTCTAGTSISQSGCSVFIPLHPDTGVEKKQYSKIITECKLTNTASHSSISIGACKIVGNAYQSIRMNGTGVSDDWNIVELELPELSYIDALEIQTTYGTYEIRKIWFE